MAQQLIVEDGTIVAGANSFVDEATFKAYADNHAWDYSAMTDPQIVTAIIFAGDYLRNEERFAYRGLRVADTQRMPWPRTSVVLLYGTGSELPSNLVPGPLQDAQCELAWKILTASPADLQPNLERGGGIASVGVAGAVNVTFQQSALYETLIQVASGILKPYLRRYRDLPLSPFHAPDLRGYADPADTRLAGIESEDGVSDRPGASDTIADTGDPTTTGGQQ